VAAREFAGGRGESGELVALAGLSVLVGLLLLVAAANASTLLLVRATERAGVMALHAALGASRPQVALQLFGEAAWIALAGGLVGVTLGTATLGWVETHLSVHWGYYWMRMEVRPAVVAWSAGIVLLTAVLAGTAPAVRAMRTDLKGVLSGRGAGNLGVRSSSLGRWFLGVQVALSTAGLVAATFLGAGVLRSRQVSEGLPLDEVVVARVQLDGRVASGAGMPVGPSGVQLIQALGEELEGLGESATLSSGVPGFGGRSSGVEILGLNVGPGERASSMAVGPGFFETYGLEVLRGRPLLARDQSGAPPVAVVNESFVRRFLSQGDPLETQLHLQGVHREGEFARIVGVVQDHVQARPGLGGDVVYLALEQAPSSSAWISVRGGGSPGQIDRAVRERTRNVHPSLAVEDVRTLRDLMDYLARIPRTVGLFGLMGGLVGVAVAAVGLFGIVSYQVRARFPELGVRKAVGATSGRILEEVVADGVKRVLPGLFVGLVLGALMSPLLVAFLFGISPVNPAIYVGVAVGMLAVGALAALGPALRAARLDPLVTLRNE
jgi:predicted permease